MNTHHSEYAGLSYTQSHPTNNRVVSGDPTLWVINATLTVFSWRAIPTITGYSDDPVTP